MILAIYGSRRQKDAVPALCAFLRHLKEEGHTVIMHTKLYNSLRDQAPEILDCITTATDSSHFIADLAISFGGDGTFLRTAMWVGSKELPIVGVNTGHLGFLSALSIHDLPNLLEDILAGKFRIERRSLLEVLEPSLGDGFCRYALNEVAVGKVESASMITAQVCIDSLPLANYRADGLIVATATGSTAYSLSVGGPIVQPTLGVCVISPVAAHSLTMRPLVADADSEISIVPTTRGTHVRLALDGRYTDVEAGTEIVIAKASFDVLVMQLSDRTFADILKDKLLWGEQ